MHNIILITKTNTMASKILKNTGVSVKQTTTTFQMPTPEHHAFKIALATNGDVMANIIRKGIQQYVESSKAAK